MTDSPGENRQNHDESTGIAPEPVEISEIYLPLPNYTLSTVCPACGDATVRRACKVVCPRCGFMWDCSEL